MERSEDREYGRRMTGGRGAKHKEVLRALLGRRIG